MITKYRKKILSFWGKEKDPLIFRTVSRKVRNHIFCCPSHAEISVATTGRDRGEKYRVGVERNERLLSGCKKIAQVLKCPSVPTQTKGGLLLIFL